jgi:hypothetical protein
VSVDNRSRFWNPYGVDERRARSAANEAPTENTVEIQMTEQVRDDVALEEAVGEVQEVEPKLALLVKAGHTDERTLQLEPGCKLTAVLEIFAAERGCKVEELVLLREGESEPLPVLVVIDAGYPSHRRHHVHHVGDVKVTVFYQADSHHREFKRHATVEDVLVWAVKVFGIDPSMATEFELARHGQKEELPGMEHIGHLAAHHHVLELDLVRGDIANGNDK